MISEVVRVGKFVEVTADGGLRFVLLGPGNSVESTFTGTDISVAAEKVDRAGTETEQLRHDCIVVVGLGDVTIGATFCCANTAGGVREVRVERLAAVTFGR